MGSNENNMKSGMAWCAAMVMLGAGSAWGQSSQILNVTPAGLGAQPGAAAPATPSAPPEAATAQHFGAAGTQWLTFGAGYGSDFEDGDDFDVNGAWSTFIADNVEFAAELAGWYHSQEQDDALSINPSIVFRWHFINTGEWTVYADVGIGVMASTEDVPENGTSFNFTPRAGAGFTKLLNDRGWRLQVGARWAHWSNARINGDDDNPGKDDVLGYVGIIVPF